ncbi:DUF2892 domain-containing protein [uncultured Thiodictyon sp.]|uniref:YgaP family membrane protein n=1 Tax=uncultured Thiodictyon sp. TaxID=1846217 RepID=UPI0025D2E204|nr:DUF2892 domain-containing protein [uncultured Thiodictyon sp.]
MAFKFKLPEFKQPEKCNVGKKDRIIRLAVAVLLLIGFYRGGFHNWVIALIALVLLATAYFGFCPAYLVTKTNTNQKD